MICRKLKLKAAYKEETDTSLSLDPRCISPLDLARKKKLKMKSTVCPSSTNTPKIEVCVRLHNEQQ